MGAIVVSTVEGERFEIRKGKTRRWGRRWCLRHNFVTAPAPGACRYVQGNECDCLHLLVFCLHTGPFALRKQAPNHFGCCKKNTLNPQRASPGIATITSLLSHAHLVIGPSLRPPPHSSCFQPHNCRDVSNTNYLAQLLSHRYDYSTTKSSPIFNSPTKRTNELEGLHKGRYQGTEARKARERDKRSCC